MNKYLSKCFFVLCVSLFAVSPLYAENYFVVKKNPIVHQHAQQSNEIEGLPKPILKAAINAYIYALQQHQVHNSHMLTIVDFNRPSYEKRLWVIDLNNDHIIMNIHVAQGRNSGKIYPTRFSNDFNSHESSLGVFTTVGHEYYGAYGKSLHVKGLESGINSNAFSRGIVIHSEWDVTPRFIRAMGYAGRTWGCFAVNPDHIDRLIELLQEGSVLFVYAKPEKVDPLVSHPLSPEGEALYRAITKTNSNPLVRFFEAF